eukprot:TRINITY_DN109167_c0_g1_i1.p1 TRINITY_DN109167_c0_g1~~TRINITY_DN109167_c0_g1_i1.p1  ORF type:complete len:520 (-),score=108.87 TRINITY_DN109167_c0_g1_i1:111-1622(-)
MGSGGSAEKKKGGDEKYEAKEEAEEPEHRARPKPKLKKAHSKARLSAAPASSSDRDEASSSTAAATPKAVMSEVRPCDHCGEMRKTTNFGGGDDAQWLCAACQLNNGGLAMGQRQKQKKLVMTDMPKPQPMLKRGATVASGELGVREKRNSEVDASGSKSPRPERRERNRRRGKCKTGVDPDHKTAESAEAKEQSSDGPKLLRAQTQALGAVGKPSHRSQMDYRSAQGLNELKEQMGVKTEDQKRADSRKKAAAEAAAADTMEAPKVPPPPPRPLPGGYTYGEKIVTLISRENAGQQLLMELGQEGTVVGAAEMKRADLRLLVQLNRGLDWWLAPAQLSQPSAFGAARAAGIFGFSWGSRVRSLVTLLHPPALRQSHHGEVWLGDEGTVIGPSAIKGKLAVRFDNGLGEWSIWPSLVCKSEAYDETVSEKIAGRLCRGDRVRSKGSLSGSRSFEDAKLSVNDGEDGTVIGPGHAPGKVLVHFDADDRVWSLDPKQLASTSSCI